VTVLVADTRDLSGLPWRFEVAGDMQRRWAGRRRATSAGDDGIHGAAGGNDRAWMHKGNRLLLECLLVFASLFLSKCDFADGDPAAAGVFASVCFSLSLKVEFC
jgi:hypothetical protein